MSGRSPHNLKGGRLSISTNDLAPINGEDHTVNRLVVAGGSRHFQPAHGAGGGGEAVGFDA